MPKATHSQNLSEQDRKQFSEMLSYLQQKLPLLHMDNEHQAQFREKLQEIKRRLDDPYFNLAIIGDFSSGKSSFINGIIHQDLLKTATLATTAIPTRIRWNSMFREVEIHLRENRSSSSVELTRLASRWKLKLPTGTAEKIDFITTNNSLAKRLEEVELRLPIDLRYQNMCLIDTPGVNPGASGAQVHIQQTQNVLRKMADATIVLFPSPSVYTKSFEEFLRDNAEHFLNHAIFVVTKMDLVQNSEREGMIRYVQQMLKKQFKLSDPQVYACSSLCALHPERRADWDQEDWSAAFQSLENAIQHHVQENRQTIITQGIRTLLAEALTLAKTTLEENRGRLHREADAFERNSIESFEAECRALLIGFEERFKDKRHRCLDSLGALAINEIEAQRGSAKSLIRACTSRNAENTSGIGYCMNQRVPDYAEQAQKRINQRLGEKSETLKEELAGYVDGLNSLLQKYNLNIAAIQADLDGAGAKGQEGFAGAMALAMAGTYTQLDKLEDAMVPMLAVAAIALPLVGITAFVDGIFDTELTESVGRAFTRLTGMFGVDSAKERALGQIDVIFDNLKRKSPGQAKASLNDFADACLNQARQALDAYVQKYDGIFREAKARGQAQRERLNQQLAQNEETFRQIERYVRLIQSK